MFQPVMIFFLLFKADLLSIRPPDCIGVFVEQETQGNARAVLAATTIVGARLRDTVFTLTGHARQMPVLSIERDWR